MKILIPGGTGAMGRHLSEILCRNGAEVTVTSRTQRPSRENLHYVQGDAQDPDFLASILKQGWDAVVDFMIYTTPAFEKKIDILLGSTDQYFFLSTGRVYADSARPIEEGSERLLDTCNDKEFLSTDEYALAKARQEDLLRRRPGRNWTIIRPYITYSEERLQLGPFEKEGWLYRALHGRPIIFSREIAQKSTALTYGLDVAKCIGALIGEPGALGEDFNIVTDEPMTWSEVMAIYLDVLERRTGFRPPVLMLDSEHFSACHTARYQISYDRLFNRLFDNRKIRQRIGRMPFTDYRSGIENCLEHFLLSPRFSAINWDIEAAKDRAAKVRAPIGEIEGMKKKIKYLRSRYFQ